MKKILLIILSVLLLLGAGAFWFVSVKGRSLIAAELVRVTGRKVTLGTARPVFPVGVRLKDLRIDGLARVPKAFLTVNIRQLLGGHVKISLLELQSPELSIALPAPDANVIPVSSPATPVQAPAAAASFALPAGRTPFIDLVRVRNATVMVQAPSTGKTWIIQNVQADVRYQEPRISFSVEASLAGLNVPFVGHLAKANGWVNWPARDMQADVEARDEDGRVGLSATALCKANDCEVKGKTTLSSSQTAQAAGKRPKMIEAMVLDMLDSSKTGIEADFSFHSALDHFQVARVNISGNITTELQTEEISGNIVGSLKAAGAKMLEKDKASTVKPFKL